MIPQAPAGPRQAGYDRARAAARKPPKYLDKRRGGGILDENRAKRPQGRACKNADVRTLT